MMWWQKDREVIWDCLLPVLFRRLGKVLHHYVPYIASGAYVKDLPCTQVQKRDSLLISQWLREMLSQQFRRDLPECPNMNIASQLSA